MNYPVGWDLMVHDLCSAHVLKLRWDQLRHRVDVRDVELRNGRKVFFAVSVLLPLEQLAVELFEAFPARSVQRIDFRPDTGGFFSSFLFGISAVRNEDEPGEHRCVAEDLPCDCLHFSVFYHGTHACDSGIRDEEHGRISAV